VDESYYTGSTINLARRLEERQSGEGANHTKKRLPAELVYFEEFNRIDLAFYREKQIQKWRREKKEALILSKPFTLPDLSFSEKTRKKKAVHRNFNDNDRRLSKCLEREWWVPEQRSVKKW